MTVFQKDKDYRIASSSVSMDKFTFSKSRFPSKCNINRYPLYFKIKLIIIIAVSHACDFSPMRRGARKGENFLSFIENNSFCPLNIYPYLPFLSVTT